MDDTQIGAAIAALRAGSGLHQSEFAVVIGISQVDVSRIEKGNRRLRLTELIKLAEHFGFSIDEFLTGGAPNNSSELYRLRDAVAGIHEVMAKFANR